MSCVSISRSLLACMRAHAARSPTLEICGLLGGRMGQAVSCYPVANVARDPTRRFDMEPRGQIDAMRVMRERGETLFAIYHSHPVGTPTPSAVDLREAAYPQALYLILAPARHGFQVSAWRLTGAGLVPLDLRVDP